MVKVCAISDLHGALPKIEECDVVFICGDIFPLEIQRINTECEAWLNGEFAEWIDNLPCEKVILIAGNHDYLFERFEYTKVLNKIKDNIKLKEKLVYLQDNVYEYKNLKIFGCPWCTGPYGWPFVDTTGEKYKLIPDCDILLTHQPPRVKQLGCSYPGKVYEENWGSEELKNKILSKNIRYNFCGHIHSGTHGGITANDCDTVFYNVSIKDEDYKVTYKPTYLEITA